MRWSSPPLCGGFGCRADGQEAANCVPAARFWYHPTFVRMQGYRARNINYIVLFQPASSVSMKAGYPMPTRQKMKHSVERLARLWCRVLHREIYRPAHGAYRCKSCLRVYRVPWAGEEGRAATLPPPHPHFVTRRSGDLGSIPPQWAWAPQAQDRHG